MVAISIDYHERFFQSDEPFQWAAGLRRKANERDERRTDLQICKLAANYVRFKIHEILFPTKAMEAGARRLPRGCAPQEHSEPPLDPSECSGLPHSDHRRHSNRCSGRSPS